MKTVIEFKGVTIPFIDDAAAMDWVYEQMRERNCRVARHWLNERAMQVWLDDEIYLVKFSEKTC